MSENVELNFEVYSHLSDLPDGERERVKDFFSTMESLGFFTRSYDTRSLELYEAAKVLHRHLCTLDTDYYNKAKGVRITELANAYAEPNELRVL